MFRSPAPTQYDLNFSLFGIPIRVHPLFWLIAVLLGYSTNIGFLLIWVFAVFISIVIHELGHSFAMRAFGVSSHIVLYFMGGLAIPDGFGYGGRRSSLTNVQHIIISLAGPFAGFLFAGLLLVIVQLTGGIFEFGSPIPLPRAFVPFGGQYQPYVNNALNSLLWINVGWGLFNLVPVYPLDGGQTMRYFLTMIDPQNGYVNSLWLSVISGAAAAIGGFIFFSSLYIALLFGLLAFQSYQMLRFR